MKKVKPVQSPVAERRMRPSLTPEARETRLASLAMDLVEKRLIEGTASAQETVYFLKAASRREKLEQELMSKQIDMTEAKTKHIESQEHNEELYRQALEAMRSYSGQGKGNDDDQDLFESD